MKIPVTASPKALEKWKRPLTKKARIADTKRRIEEVIARDRDVRKQGDVQ